MTLLPKVDVPFSAERMESAFTLDSLWMWLQALCSYGLPQTYACVYSYLPYTQGSCCSIFIVWPKVFSCVFYLSECKQQIFGLKQLDEVPQLCNHQEQKKWLNLVNWHSLCRSLETFASGDSIRAKHLCYTDEIFTSYSQTSRYLLRKMPKKRYQEEIG